MTLALSSLAVLAACMVALWLVSLHLRDASIVDPFWGLAFAVVAALGCALGPGALPRRVLVMALVGAWGLRLFLHLSLRARGRGEDHRYAAMRRAGGGAWWWRSLFVVFLLQAALAWLVSAPVQAAAHGSAPLGALDLAGAVVCLAGLACEAIADHQLTRFVLDPRSPGRVLDTGLWRYSRHPNYFGDCVVWWGLGLVGLAAGPPWVLAGPLLMTILLLRVSGVTLLEKTIGKRRPGYAEYAARTSAFVPWPPRRP